jgi:hypothetical protein
VNIELEREEDGRWIAEVPDLPGVMVYGQSSPVGSGEEPRLAGTGLHASLRDPQRRRGPGAAKAQHIAG